MIRRLTVSAIPLVLVAGHAPADSPNSTPVLEEIIVTAQRQERVLQDVPIAVTALTGRDLERRQIVELQGLQYAVPSLAIFPVVANSMTAVIGLRGLAEFDPAPTFDPAVGLYVDGVSIARATGANMNLVDVKRVEVLRGPQGTLFGRNTIGGAINIVPNKPTFALESSVAALLGVFDRVDATAVVNVPFAGRTSAVRVALQHTEHSGFGRAVLLNRDLSDDDTDYARVQLRLSPADAWTLDLSYDLTSSHTGAQLMTYLAGNEYTQSIPAAAGHPEDDLSRYSDVDDGQVYSNHAGDFDARAWGTSAILTGGLGAMTAKSITAWRSLDVDIHDSDYDGTPYDIFTLVRRQQHEEQFSQEFQVAGHSFAGRVDWTGGLLYFSETADWDAQNLVLFPLTQGQDLVRATTDNETVAAYAELTGALTPAIRLTAGVRYNVDWRQLISRNAGIEDGIETCALEPDIRDPGGACRATLPRREYAYWPYTLGIDYRPDDRIMLYAKVSRGERAGGYNMRGATPTDLLPVGPEQVTSYEIGAKADLWQRRLRVNLAIFHADYGDMQVSQAVADPVQTPTFIRQNAGRAAIDGGELEVTALLGPARFTGEVGLADGRITNLEPGVDEDIHVGEQIATPTTTYSVALDLPVRLGEGSVNLHADYSGHDDDMALPGNLRDNSIAILNAAIVYRFPQTDFEIGVWGRNLSDREYMAQAVDFDFLVNEIPGDPRTYGVSFTYRFTSTDDSR